MPIEPRLIVTGHTPEGEAVFVEDRRPEPVSVQALPGADFFLLWGTPDGVAKVGELDAAPVLRPYFPGLGGSRALFLRWAPYSAEPEPAVDPDVVAGEVADKLPGLLDPFEEGGDGMHTTDTVDYCVVVRGEMTLELDDGQKVHLRQGDCVVQNGTRHRWRNPLPEPCLMAFISVGGKRT